MQWLPAVPLSCLFISFVVIYRPFGIHCTLFVCFVHQQSQQCGRKEAALCGHQPYDSVVTLLWRGHEVITTLLHCYAVGWFARLEFWPNTFLPVRSATAIWTVSLSRFVEQLRFRRSISILELFCMIRPVRSRTSNFPSGSNLTTAMNVVATLLRHVTTLLRRYCRHSFLKIGFMETHIIIRDPNGSKGAWPWAWGPSRKNMCRSDSAGAARSGGAGPDRTGGWPSGIQIRNSCEWINKTCMTNIWPVYNTCLACLLCMA